MGDTCEEKLQLAKARPNGSVGEAILALIFTDGSVQLLKIQQHAKQKPDSLSEWNCTIGEPINVDGSDHRPVTAVKWVKVWSDSFPVFLTLRGSNEGRTRLDEGRFCAHVCW